MRPMNRLPEALLQHLRDPRHVGEPAGGATHRGEAQNPACRDLLVIFLRVEEGCVGAAGFQATGCPAALGMSSAATELLPGLVLGAGLPEQLRERFVEAYGEPEAMHRHALNLLMEAVSNAVRG
jgi:nitrogen fixation protein NifU and related proteins